MGSGHISRGSGKKGILIIGARGIFLFLGKGLSFSSKKEQE